MVLLSRTKIVKAASASCGECDQQNVGVSYVCMTGLHSTQVVQRQAEVVTLSMEASQEAALEGLLDNISSKWSSIDLTVVPFKDVKDAFVLGSVEDVTAALEDTMVTMSTILASRQVHHESCLQPCRPQHNNGAHTPSVQACCHA